MLLSQVHRLRALVLLGRFLDMGSWAVDLALSVGIFPYVLKLLQTTASDLRTTPHPHLDQDPGPGQVLPGGAALKPGLTWAETLYAQHLEAKPAELCDKYRDLASCISVVTGSPLE